MTIYNYHEEEQKHTDTKWVLLELVTQSGIISTHFDPAKLDVQLTINGIEVDMMNVVNQVIQRTDELAIEKAKDILAEKIYDLSNTIEQAQEMFNKLIDSSHNKDGW